MSPLAISREVLAAYRRHWKVLLGAAFLLFGVFNLLETVLPETEVDHFETRALIEAIALGGGAFAFSAFEEAFYEGVVAGAAAEWRLGRPHAGLVVIARSVPYLALVLVNLVVAFGSAVGLLFLVVPGFVFGTYVALAPALVKIEHLGVRAAVGRSFQLVRGHFWAVAVLLWGVYLASEAATSTLDVLLHHVVFEWVAKTVAESLLAPLYGLAMVFATYDLIGRRAGARKPPPPDAPAT